MAKRKSNQNKSELALLGAGEYMEQLELLYVVGTRWHSHVAVYCKSKHTFHTTQESHIVIQVK